MKSSHGRHFAFVVVCTVFSSKAAVRYVNVNSTNATLPFTTWSTAAMTIQDAIDAADPGDEILVTNGVYQTGGRSINRVAVDKPLVVRSVNGPQFSVIEGRQVPAIRCVYLTNGASLLGFTLTNGATPSLYDVSQRVASGGAVWCESKDAVVANCVMVANSARQQGGGAYQGTLYSCTIVNNQVTDLLRCFNFWIDDVGDAEEYLLIGFH